MSDTPTVITTFPHLRTGQRFYRADFYDCVTGIKKYLEAEWAKLLTPAIIQVLSKKRLPPLTADLVDTATLSILDLESTEYIYIRESFHASARLHVQLTGWLELNHDHHADRHVRLSFAIELLQVYRGMVRLLRTAYERRPG